MIYQTIFPIEFCTALFASESIFTGMMEHMRSKLSGLNETFVTVCTRILKEKGIIRNLFHFEKMEKQIKYCHNYRPFSGMSFIVAVQRFLC